MIYLNNTNELINSLDIEKATLESRLSTQEKTKSIISNYIQNFANSTDNVDLNSTQYVKELFNDLKSSLNLCNENISYYNNLIMNLDNVIDYSEKSIVEFKKELTIYNSKYIDADQNILANNEKIQNSLLEVSTKSIIQFPITEAKNDIDYKVQENIQTQNSCVTQEIIINTDSNNIQDENNIYKENTLIVSERSGNVILPYRISDLEKYVEQEPNKYYSIDSVIAKKYTLPLRIYNNSFISRFRESFKLMRTREKSSIRDALDLGLELMFYYKLHPAIISACKNMEELDTYLDYLEMGRTDKFDCFKIIFELPLAVQHKMQFKKSQS